MTPLVVVATPFYDHSVRVQYNAAQWALMGSPHAEMLGTEEERTTIYQSHDVCLGRARCVRDFLRLGRGTHLLFWDSDVCGDVGAAVRGMLAEGVGCIGATYPKKHIRPDGDVDFCLSTAGQSLAVQGNRAALPPMGFVGAGFLLLSRPLLERMSTHYFDALFFEDEDDSTTVDLFAKIRERDHGGRMRSRPEDFSFCRRVALMGETVWLYTGAAMDHVGMHVFRGDRAGLAGG